MDTARDRATRTRARWSIALAAFAGWSLALGIATNLYLYDKVSWSTVCFAVGALAAIATTWIRGVFLPTNYPEPEPDAKRHVWFTGVAEQLGISSSYLRRQAGLAEWSAQRVRWTTWAPYWLLVAFWVVLWLAWPARMPF